MTDSQTKETVSKKRGKKLQSPGARRVGYIFSIIFSIIFLYILRHLRDWGVTFLTEDFERCLFYIELAIYVSIGGYALLIVYDKRWFKHLIQVVINSFNALSTIMVWVIFPFALENDRWIWWIKIGILVIFILTVITAIVELIKGLRYLVKDTRVE